MGLRFGEKVFVDFEGISVRVDWVSCVLGGAGLGEGGISWGKLWVRFLFTNLTLFFFSDLEDPEAGPADESLGLVDLG